MASITIDEAFSQGIEVLRRIDVEPADLYTVLDDLKGVHNVYGIYHATWCPDSQAVPAMISAITANAIKNNLVVTIILCDIGEKSIWKYGDHIFKQRTSRLYLNQGIPTLIKYDTQGLEKFRLFDDLSDGMALKTEGEEAVKVMVTNFIESSQSQ